MDFDPSKPFDEVPDQQASLPPQKPDDQDVAPSPQPTAPQAAMKFDPSQPFEPVSPQPKSLGQGLMEKGQQQLDKLRGRDQSVDYQSGVPFGVRIAMARAENPKEAQKVLEKQYGQGNYGQDEGGNWWAMQDGKKVAVNPSGFWQGAENFAAGLAGSATPMAGAIAGGTYGAGLGGPFGAAIGSGLGAAGGWGIDQAVKYYQNLYDQTPEEALKHASNEATLNTAMAGAIPAAQAIGRPIAQGVRSFLGTTPTTQAMTERLVNEGARPPIQSVAPDFRSWGDKQVLRNAVAGDPWEETNAGIVRDKFANALKSSGASDAEVASFMKEASDPLAAQQTRFAGEQLTQSVQQRLGQYRAEADASRIQAQQQLGQMEQALRGWAQAPESLGHDVSNAIIQSRQQFGAAASKAYRAIDQMTGETQVFSMGPTVRAANEMIDLAEPGLVPRYIQSLADRDPSTPITFAEAHELRSNLREIMGNGVDLTRSPAMHKISDIIDSINGTFKQMETSGNLPGVAAQSLRQMDKVYGEGIAKYYNAQITKLVRDVRSGLAPNPEVVAGTVLRDGQDAAARQILKMVPDDVRTNIFKADMRNIVWDSSKRAPDGSNQLDGMAFLDQLDRRAPIYREFYGPQNFQAMRDLGRNFAALDGKLDVSNLPPSKVTSAISDYIGRTRQLDEFVRGNPIGALASGRPEVVDRAVQAFSQPGREAMTESAMKFFGENSQEWQAVQKAAQGRLIRSALVETPSRTPTISGDAIERALSKYTPKQQEMLFPNGMADDLKEVAKDARFLFPSRFGKSGLDMASGMAAKGITLHTGLNIFNPRTAYADMKWITTSMMGWLTDRPAVLRFLADAGRSNPTSARMILSTLSRWIVNEQTTGPGKKKAQQSQMQQFPLGKQYTASNESQPP